MAQPEDDPEDVELPLIPRPPRSPALLELDPASDADAQRPDEPAYSRRGPFPAYSATSNAPPSYSVRPPPVAPVASAPSETIEIAAPPEGISASASPPGTEAGGSVDPPAPPPRRPARTSGPPPSSTRKRGRFGRGVAIFFCVLFATIGFIPVFAAVLVRTPAVQAWASRETAVLLERELGARASYDVRVKPWPLTVGVENLVIEGDDGLGDFLTVETASIRPRIFSLLAGKLDVGDIEVTGAHARVVLRDGELVNFRPKKPEPSAESERSERAPFRALALTDATVDLDIDGTLVYVTEVDLDVVSEPDGSFELAARAGGGTLSRVRPDPRHPEEQAADEDRLCQLEARARVDPKAETLLVRRLGLGAVVDFDPDLDTRPACDLPEKDWRRLDVRLGAVEVPATVLRGEGIQNIAGRVALTAPAALVHRFVAMPHLTGSVRVEVEATKAPQAKTPLVTGKVHADFIGLDGKVFSDYVDTNVQFDGSAVVATDIKARWADGDFAMERARFSFTEPGMTLDVRNIKADHVGMQGLLRDLGVHPQSHVGWTLDHVEFESFGGTIDPLNIEGKLVTSTSDFGVYDRPSHREDKQRMISIDRGEVKGTLAIRKDAVYLDKMHLVTPRSSVFTTVKLGFLDEFGLDISQGSYVDLAEISPLVSVAIGGKATVHATGTGTFDYPRIEGELKIDGFELGGFKAGDIRTSHAVFVPLSLELTEVELAKNQSLVTSTKTKVDFDAGADVLVDAELQTTQAPYLKVSDFFEVFQLDKDPRFKNFAGTGIGTATVHYAIGGPEDKCGGGLIDVRTKMQLDRPDLFGESFERGSMDVHFRWDDARAGAEGMEIELVSATVQDATGSITAQADVRHGGELRGTAVVAGMPLAKLEGFGPLRDYLDGEVSAVATLGGTLARMSADLDVSVSPLRFGASKMPSSRFSVRLEPDPMPPAIVGRSTCGLPISPPHDPNAPDTASGSFRINGQLFDGQVAMSDVTITNQSNKIVAGRVTLNELDLGTIAGGLPIYALGGKPPDAKISAVVDVARLETANLAATEASIDLRGVHVSRGGRTVKLARSDAPVVVKNGDLSLPEIGLSLEDKSGVSIGFTAKGKILRVFQEEPKLDASVTIAPFDLATLRDDIPSVDRIAGILSGSVEVTGNLTAPKVTGYAKLRDGALAITDVPATLEQIAVDIALGDGEVRVTKATASVGAGTIDVTGRIPIEGLGYGTGSATITARGVKLPVGEGIDVVSDADLDLTIPASWRTDDPLPELRGTVSVTSFLYKRPIALSLDLGELSRTIGRSEVDAYDPEGDFLKFALKIVSPRPLVVRNDLADVRLEIVDPGLEVSGTNQRYGAKGALKVLQDSKIRLRNHEFDVREGYVRFNDPTKVKAEIDVQASTDMRRYASAQAESTTETQTGSTTAGQWDVNIHAHGSTEDLKLDLSSDPPMDQEDIVLLLTVGMTRAEIDRGLATSLGETVGLEALSALTGADKAVKSVVPIIDYFHFGSSYSARTGRTEPNVTVGKRINDDVRASVTTTLTERDVAATLEWRLKKGVSIQASYDNTNDIGTIIGNLGADLRWRLEFE
ncbi:MAG: hypothetical protein HOW73_16615 [Polyangiaceae bacterium]|nr:hypothetical protein [Polyangiaceae bacterium]